MLRKLLSGSTIFTGCVSSVFAATVYISPGVEFDTYRSGDGGYNTFAPRLTAGFSSPVSLMFVGLEAFATQAAIKQLDNVQSTGISLQASTSVGGSLLLGFMFDPSTIFYGRAGGISTKFTDLGEWRPGFQGGVGLQINVCDPWAVRGEVDYTSYRGNVDLNGHLSAYTYMASLLYNINF